MFWIDARLALVCMTGAPLIIYPLVRLGQRVRRTTRRSQEALEQISHLSTETFTGHRIVKAVRDRAAGRRALRRAAYRLFRTNMKVTASMATLPPLMELLGGVGMALALWYGVRQISCRQPDAGAIRRVLYRRVHDVRTGEEAQSRQREPAAGDCRGGAHLRDARHPHGSARATGCRAARAVPGHHRIPRRCLRLRGCAGPLSFTVFRSKFAPARWSRLSGAAAPARRRW
jgi:hypothetical protein